MCSIVHSTICQTSLSTQGGPSSPHTQARYPSPVSPSPSGGSVVPPAGPAPTGIGRATSPLTRATTMTRGNSSIPSVTTGDDADTTPTQTDDYAPTSSTASPVPVSTGASNTLSVVRGVAIDLTA